MTGFNSIRGTVRRAYYALPGMDFMGFSDDYLWSLSELAVLTWMFYEHVELVKESEGGYRAPVLLAWRPRDEAVPYEKLRKGYTKLTFKG